MERILEKNKENVETPQLPPHEEIPEEMSDNSYNQQLFEKSICTQTESVNYSLSIKNKKTQTPIKAWSHKDVKTRGTQTLLTAEYLSQLMHAPAITTVTSATQTDASDFGEGPGTVGECEDNSSNIVTEVNREVVPNQKASPLSEHGFDNSQQLPSDPIELPSDGFSIDKTDEEYPVQDEREDEGDQDEAKYVQLEEKQTTLTGDKSYEDQIKLVVWEESIANVFRFCFKCHGLCTIVLKSKIGTYCKISVLCPFNPEHNFSWTTGPVSNRLPILNLMIASSIVSTGMEPSKVLRFMDSLNILTIKPREFSNLQSAYVIPAIFNVWKKEQDSLLDGIKDKPICIASDMRVDSPGHCGVFGSGSTLDVDRNVILDTQVIKVCTNFNLVLLLFSLKILYDVYSN